MQKVARDTLARRERKQLHLRAARFLESEWAAGEDEIVEVMAAHYLDAYEADRQAEDAPAIVKRAGELLIRAGRRAQSLGANVEAEQHFASAAKLTDDPRTQADLLARAGQAALAAGRIDQADTHFGRASALAHDAEDLHLRARVTAHIAEVFWLRGNLTQAIELMEDAFTTVSEHERDLDLATLATQLGRFHIVAANYERGLEVLDIALEIAESWTATDLISEALNSKALAYASERPQEGIALLEQARKLAVEHDHVAAMLRAYNNLGHVMLELSRYADGAAYLEQAVALARGRGYRGWQWAAIGGLIESLHYLGRWDEAVEHYEQIPEDAPTHGLTAIIGGTFPVGRIATARGEAADLARRLEGLEAVEADMQEWVTLTLVRAILARSEGRYADALALGDEACAVGREARLHFYSVEAWVEAVESALALGDLDGVRERIAQLDARPPVQIGPYLAAHRARLTARVNPDDGEEFTRAVTLFREIGARFWLGVALLEQSEWLYDRDDREAATPGLAEATAIFEELRARPWLERALALVAPEGTPAIAAAPRA
jgi:tetratricopeptide (TPR) repeat protein